MSKLKLRGKDLRGLGYPEGPVISIAMNVMAKNYKFESEETVMNLLKSILANPVEYADDAILGLIAQQLLPKTKVRRGYRLPDVFVRIRCRSQGSNPKGKLVRPRVT